MDLFGTGQGRVSTVAEQQAALQRLQMKKNIFTYFAQAFKSHKVTPNMPIPTIPIRSNPTQFHSVLTETPVNVCSILTVF